MNNSKRRHAAKKHKRNRDRAYHERRRRARLVQKYGTCYDDSPYPTTKT